MIEPLVREDLAALTVMIFDAAGNAIDLWEYTPEAMATALDKLRRSLGETSIVTYGPSPFITDCGGVLRIEESDD